MIEEIERADRRVGNIHRRNQRKQRASGRIPWTGPEPSLGEYSNGQAITRRINENLAPFRDKRKLKALATLITEDRGEPNRFVMLSNPVNSFPMKANKKKYCLKALYPPGWWQMDIFIDHGLYYLLLVEGTSRFLCWATINKEIGPKGEFDPITGSIPAAAFVETMERLFGEDPNMNDKIRFLQCDGEKAFNSEFTVEFLNRHDITLIPVVMRHPLENPQWNEWAPIPREPNHTSLSLVDRMCRTLRDMAFNVEVRRIYPAIMRTLTLMYNGAPHRTLTKIMRFPVSPFILSTLP
jgi:hypothetical protein